MNAPLGSPAVHDEQVIIEDTLEIFCLTAHSRVTKRRHPPLAVDQGSVVVNTEARFTADEGPTVVVMGLPAGTDDDSACGGTGKLSHGDAFDVT
ncbi:MAG: hypothetical protein M3Y26_03045 [Actinomycetota bacterium]|nr:hypothetical protein [Actinomycetota bacterium]